MVSRWLGVGEAGDIPSGVRPIDEVVSLEARVAACKSALASFKLARLSAATSGSASVDPG